jgi:hypothetical protein
MMPNDGMVGEHWTENNIEGIGGNLISGFRCERVATLQAEIWTRDILDIEYII